MAVTYVRNSETGEFEQVGPGGATTDTTLSQSGKPADASAVGVALANKATKEYVDTSVASFSNPNLLINGDFQIWQRGESFSSIANKYSADRWLIKNAKASTALVEKSTDVPDGQPMCQSIHMTETTEENSYLRYMFEHALKGTFTLSFWYKTSAAFNTYIYDDGVLTHLGKLTTLNTWTKATFTFSATSLTFLSIIHAMSVGDTYIAGVKLEYGNVATPFTPRLYLEEFAMCQRYFLRLQSICPMFMAQQAATHTYAYMSIPLTVPLMGQPSITFYNAKLLKNGTDGEVVNITSMACAGYSKISVTVQMVIGSNYEIGVPYFLTLPDSGYIDFDAEIY